MSVATGPLAVAKDEGDLGKAGTSLEGSSFGKRCLPRRWGSGSGEKRAQELEDKCKLERIWPQREKRRDFEETFDCEVLQLVGEVQDEKQVFNR